MLTYINFYDTLLELRGFMRDGLGVLLLFVGGTTFTITEIATTVLSFKESIGLGILNLTPVGWFICPFVVGTWIYFLLAAACGFLAFLLTDF